MSLNGVHRQVIRDHFKKLLGGKCDICGEKEDLTFHHIIPCGLGRSRGSDYRAWTLFLDYDDNNLRLLCNSCHVELHRNEAIEATKASRIAAEKALIAVVGYDRIDDIIEGID